MSEQDKGLLIEVAFAKHIERLKALWGKPTDLMNLISTAKLKADVLDAIKLQGRK